MSLIKMSSIALMDFFSVTLNNCYMDTIEITRVKRLLLLKKEFGSLAEIYRLTGVSDTQLSQWVNQSPDSKTGRPRVMHSDSARKLEVGCKKPNGWMDQPVIDAEEINREYSISTEKMSIERIQAHQALECIPEEDLPHVKRILGTYDGIERRKKPRNKRESNSNK